MRRRLAVLAGLFALLAAVVAAPAAVAATYPPSGNAVVLPDGATDIVVGDQVSISAQVFLPSSDVTFTITTDEGLKAVKGGALAGAALAGTAAGDCESGSSCVVAADDAGV